MEFVLYAKSKLNYFTTNLKKHLQKLHPIQFLAAEQVFRRE